MRTLLLSLPVFGICCVVRSEEIDWRPVTQLRAVVEDIELVTTSGTRMAKGVILTGLVSTDQLASNATLGAEQPDSKVAVFDPVNFHLERQEAPIGELEKEWPKWKERALPPWTTVELNTLTQVLDDAKSFDPEIVPKAYVQSEFTMPLPQRTGNWSESVSHPELKGSLKLLRIIDFSVVPGNYYRYRVNIEYRNPGYQKDADPFVASGRSRTTPWSVPTATVKILQTNP